MKIHTYKSVQKQNYISTLKISQQYAWAKKDFENKDKALFESGSSPTLPGKLPVPASCSYFLLLLLIFLLLLLSSSDIHAHEICIGRFGPNEGFLEL